MSKPQFVYVTHIKTTPEQLWEALRDPELTRRYWSRHRNASDWQVGSKWEHQNYDDATIVDIVGEVIESVPPKRLVISWADPREAGDPSKYSRVTFEIEPAYGSVQLTVTHENLEAGSKMLAGISKGWPIVLSSLKSILETGEPLPGTDRCWKG
jgi:uncharacterized protein YndB with AHSA1/START domain